MSRFATEVLPVLLLVLFVIGQAGVAALLVAFRQEVRREMAHFRSQQMEIDQRLTELLRPKIEP